MATQVVVRLSLDANAVRALTSGHSGPVVQGVRRASGRARDLAKLELTAAGRVDTGMLRNSITNEVVVQGSDVVGRVTARTSYAEAVHEGTGIYGPTGQPIVPRRAKVLRFRPRGSTSYVFRPSVRGVKPTPYLTNALERLSASDFT